MPSQIAIYSTGNVAKLNVITGTINMIAIVVTYGLWKMIHTEPYVIFIIQIFFTFIVQFINMYLQKNQLGIEVNSFIRIVLVRITYTIIIASILPIIIHFGIEDGLLSFIMVCISILIYSIPILFYIGIDKIMRDNLLMRIRNRIITK